MSEDESKIVDANRIRMVCFVGIPSHFLFLQEPIPAKGMPACPDWLMPEAKKEWESLSMRRILCYT